MRKGAHEAGVCVDPKRGPAGGNATGESGENPGNSGSMVDHVLAHGFAGAEGVCPSDDGDAAEVEPGLAEDAVDGTVVAADGENTATCGEGLQVAELGENREIDTNEANFREDVITTQTREDLGVTAELAVGAGLDSGVDRRVVSPDLVCPDSERGSGEAAITVDGPGSQTPATILDQHAVLPDLVEAAITVDGLDSGRRPRLQFWISTLCCRSGGSRPLPLMVRGHRPRLQLWISERGGRGFLILVPESAK